MIPPSVCDVLPPSSGCNSSHRQPVALSRPEIRPDRAGYGLPVAPPQQAVKQNAIAYAFQQLKNNPREALHIAQRALAQSNNAHQRIHIVTLKARALFEVKRYNQCLSFINELPFKLQNQRTLCLAKGRALQELERLPEALDVFRPLYDKYSDSPKDEKICGLALVRALQKDGRPAKLTEGLEILKQLRKRAANNKDDTPCHDKQIELALARHLQQLEGKDNLQAALAILTTLRERATGHPQTPCHDKETELALARLLQQMGGKNNLQAAMAILATLRERATGHPQTPCHDKEIELALARLLQQMGGKNVLHTALAIFTRLRSQAAGGIPDTPCNDKNIELALGRHLQLMGDETYLQAALAIFTRLRAQAAGGRPNTPCDNKEIELALGRHYS